MRGEWCRLPARHPSARVFAGQLVTLVLGMAVLQSTRLKDLQSDFDAAHRVALELLVASWIPAQTNGGGA